MHTCLSQSAVQRATVSRMGTVQSGLLHSFCQLQMALKIYKASFVKLCVAMWTLEEVIHCPDESPLESTRNPLESSDDSPQTRVRRNRATVHNTESEAMGVQVHLKLVLSPPSLKLS